MAKETLSVQRKAFVDAYFECFNASEAARRASYSERSAGTTGHRLLQIAEKFDENVPISVYFSQCLNEQTVSAEEVRIRLGELARAKYADYIGADGSVDLQGLKDAELMHLVKSVKPTQYGTVVEFYDAGSALIKVGETHGLFKQVNEHTGQDGGAIRVVIEYADSDA